MISKTWSRKWMAASLAVAVLSVYSMVALAGAKAPSGELSVLGEVTVNGQKVISGGTLFSDSVIATAEKSSATVSISKLGRVVLAPNSSLRLTFTENSIMGTLDAGNAQFSTVAGVNVNITTKDGAVIADGSEAHSFAVSVIRGVTTLATIAGKAELRSGGAVKQVAAGETASSAMPNPQAGTDDDDLSSGELAVLLLAVGGAIAGVIFAVTHNNDLNFGGTVNVVSPTK